MNQAAMTDEITPEQEQARQAQIERLDAFSDTIRKLRKTAIDARVQMGIEDHWNGDEEHYEAIDDANRTTASRLKPYDFGGTGSGPTQTPSSNRTGSSVFIPMTRPYVDMASALIADLYLPTDDRNWDGEPTPVPELIKQAEQATPPPVPMQPAPPAPAPAPAPAPMQPGQMPGQAIPGQPMPPMMPPVQQTAGDLAKQEIERAEESWGKARTQIDDWLGECAYNAEMRKVIKDMARIGVGIMKGPYPKAKSTKAVVQTPDGFAIEIQQKVIPASKRIDPWRFYPDPACGENINDGSYVFEQDFITRNKLRDMRKLDGYIESQIDKCIEEGPVSATGTRKSKAEARNESDLYEIWYFEGQVDWEDLDDAGCHVEGKKGDSFHAIITMVNERVIKAALCHLDSDEFTYDVSVWQRKSGLWIGDGVGRQGRTAQRGLNAAVRNLMDNAGRSSRPHTVINRSAVTPGPDPYTWYMKGDTDLSQVSHAMMFFNVPSMQAELMAIIQYFSKMFEDSTGLPMMMQGQQGAAPETVGGMQLLMNNASIVPRDIVRRIDDTLTEPHINRYYEYLMIHGEDNRAKGEFNIHARGSSALMERAAQDRFLLQLVQFSANPAFGLDPELLMQELLRSVRINPDRVSLSDQKKQEMAQRQPPPPEDPKIVAAKITADAWLKREQIMAQGKAAVADIQAKSDADHEAADAHLEMTKLQFAASEAEKDRQSKMAIQMIEAQLSSAELSSVERQVLDKIKAGLASTAMKLRTQSDLSAADISHQSDLAIAGHAADLHKHHNPQVITPPTEPAGRAPDGQAFSA